MYLWSPERKGKQTEIRTTKFSAPLGNLLQSYFRNDGKRTHPIFETNRQPQENSTEKPTKSRTVPLPHMWKCWVRKNVHTNSRRPKCSNSFPLSIRLAFAQNAHSQPSAMKCIFKLYIIKLKETPKFRIYVTAFENTEPTKRKLDPSHRSES